jgi:hypothetical protein
VPTFKEPGVGTGGPFPARYFAEEYWARRYFPGSYNDGATGAWVPLAAQLDGCGGASSSAPLPPSAVLDSSLVVPTVDTARHGHMLAAGMDPRLLGTALAAGLLGEATGHVPKIGGR